MLAFCGDLDYPLHLFFDQPAKPILMTNSATPMEPIRSLQAALGHDMTIQPGAVRFTADIVMATLQPDHESTQASQSQSQSQSQRSQQSSMGPPPNRHSKPTESGQISTPDNIRARQ